MTCKRTKGQLIAAALRRRPMTWAAVPGWEKYEVSDVGHVRRVETGHLLVQSITPNGHYATVRLSIDGKARTFAVHRLVLMAFVGLPPDGMQTRHLDGDGLNNALSNLRYGSAQENADDKKRHGTVLAGMRHGMATVSDEEIVDALRRARHTSLEVEARRLSISPSTLSMVRRGVNRPYLRAQIEGLEFA